jgi:hypothetical protein
METMEAEEWVGSSSFPTRCIQYDRGGWFAAGLRWQRIHLLANAAQASRQQKNEQKIHVR